MFYTYRLALVALIALDARIALKDENHESSQVVVPKSINYF